MRAAAIAYRCEAFAGWADQERKLDALIGDAGADLAVLPEYGGMEAALLGGSRCNTAMEWADLASDRSEAWRDQTAHIAALRSCHILAGSMPVRTERGLVNRTWLITPSGRIGVQDKMIPTPYERTELGMVGGEELCLFETGLGRVGVLICYDSEFPLLARALAKAGAELLLVPSCTDFEAGQTRVRQSCRARAIEQQMPVIQSPLVGQVPDCEIVDRSTGRAGIFCPPDLGLPPSGIVAEGDWDRQGAVVAEIDLAALSAPRLSGQVGNFGDWPKQWRQGMDVPLPPVRLVDLR